MNYEVKILKATEEYFDRQLQAWQNDGWEIAGPIVVEPQTSYNFIYAPMKRKEKEPVWQPDGFLEGGGGL